MAIDDTQYREVDDLARHEKSFYPVRIPVSHWQLRHYISTSEPDLLYYAASHDIFCLDTQTKKRRLIATIPFEARCTASGYGWVCVGGGDNDPGHFAAIKLDGSGPRSFSVDEALPMSQWGQEERRPASIKVERIGEQIVNSISIHRIRDEEMHLDDIVAVLTNNDHTVRLYSLPANLETTVLDLVFPINHATISPDGQTLVAVGDHNQAFFFRREIQEVPPQIHKPHNRLTSASIEWKLRSVVNLHASLPEITTGYFTTAWSPNGQLVALGSEGGYITVFDMDILLNPAFDDAEAAVATIAGSRPDCNQPHPGAIRSMVFAPDPWDLLIWAEDQGRICIGDLRTGLRTRQIVRLDPKDQTLKHITYDHVQGDAPIATHHGSRDIDELEADFIQRYRQAPDNAAAVNFATEYIEARRRQRQQRRDMASMRAQMNRPERSILDEDQHGLTAREQQILESLRTSRLREEARAIGGLPRSVNYTSSDLFRDSSANGRSSSATPNPTESTARPRSVNEMIGVAQDHFPELTRTTAVSDRPTSSHGDGTSNLPSLSSLQETIWGFGNNQRSTMSLVRLSDGSRLPRRRPSVVLTPPRTDTGSSSPPSNAERLSGNGHDNGNGNTSTASAAAEDENPWRIVEEHMSLARGPLFENRSTGGSTSNANNNTTTGTSTLLGSATTPTEAELQAELAAERARARSLARQRDQWRIIRAAPAGNAAAAAIPSRPSNSTVAATASSTATAAAAGPSANSAFEAARAETLARRPPTYQESYETLQRSRDLLRTGGLGSGRYGAREVGVRTAGLAVSPDGRTLWAACEEGIFEIDIHVKGRMFWPSVEPR